MGSDHESLVVISCNRTCKRTPLGPESAFLKQVLAQEFVYAFPRTSDSRLLEVAVLRTETVRDISEFSQQDGRKVVTSCHSISN